MSICEALLAALETGERKAGAFLKQNPQIISYSFSIAPGGAYVAVEFPFGSDFRADLLHSIHFLAALTFTLSSSSRQRQTCSTKMARQRNRLGPQLNRSTPGALLSRKTVPASYAIYRNTFRSAN
jgi:hypothetical protein